MTTIATESTGNRAIGKARWEAASAWCGIAFVPVFIVGLFMAMSTPDGKDNDAKWLAWYNDSGHQTTLLIGGYLLVISALLFLVFSAGLHERLRALRDSAPVLYRTAAATAVIFAGLVMVGAIQLVGVAGNLAFGDVQAPQSADILRQNIGFPFIFVAGGLTAAAFIAAATTLARSAGMFASWLVGLSYVLAVLLLLAVLFIPMVALPVWVLIVSIVLMRGSATAQRHGHAAHDQL